jgi:hypothetical protein
MRKLIAPLLLFAFFCARSQDQAVQDIKATGSKQFADDTSHKSGWKKGGLLNLGVAQGGTRNWAAGGEKFSLALNGYVNVFANLKKGKQRWNNNLDLFYALVKTTSQGLRKNDDRIDLFSKYTYQFRPKLGFGGVGNFRSQFTDGYDYSKTPSQRISSWFAPAIITLAPGIDWTPKDYFSVFFSPISARWTIVANRPFELAALYGVSPYREVKIEAGAYVTANFNKEVMKNVVLKSRLDLYSNYLKNPQNIDVFWTNVVGLKVNKFLSVTYNLDLIYDDDARIFGPNRDAPRTQLKSLLSVGFTAKL